MHRHAADPLVVVERGRERAARARSGRRRTAPPGSPSRAATSRAHVAPRASRRPVVDAFVLSLASTPVSHRLKRSGTSAIRSAAASAAEPRSAISWKTVLIGIVWMPVTAYSSLARDERVRRLDHPVRARVAVVEREPEHAVVPVEQRVVDAPRVHADAAQLRAPGRLGEAVQRLGEQRHQVPAHPVGQAHGAVLEAVHLLEPDPGAVVVAEHHAAALGAEVHRGVGGLRQGGRPPRRARSRRRRSTAPCRPASAC